MFRPDLNDRNYASYDIEAEVQKRNVKLQKIKHNSSYNKNSGKPKSKVNKTERKFQRIKDRNTVLKTENVKCKQLVLFCSN